MSPELDKATSFLTQKKSLLLYQKQAQIICH